MKNFCRLVLINLLLLGAAQAASFDCARAGTSIEKMICADPELSALDGTLALHYKKALEASRSPTVLREQQRLWLREVRNRCIDVPCLRAAYRQWTKRFEWTTKLETEKLICEELRNHVNRRTGLTSYALELEETGGVDYNFRIPKIDIDGDKVSDKLWLFLSGSASLIPPDNSSILLALSSTGQSFAIEAQGIYVIRYASKYFALTTNWLGEDGPVQKDVYQLERRGITKLCSYECGLADGSCGLQ